MFSVFKPEINRRFIYSNLKNRGSNGESIIHICLLQTSKFYFNIARRIISIYPTLVNDIYIDADHYGDFVKFSFCSFLNHLYIYSIVMLV